MSDELRLQAAIAAWLAHSIVYFTKDELSPGGVVDDAVNGGDPKAPNLGRQAAEIMGALQTNLPGYMQTLSANIVPWEQQRLQAMQATSPAVNNLQTRLFQRNAPKLAATAQNIEQEGKLRGSQGDLAVLQGPGAEAARAALNISKEIDPQFYSTRDTMSGLLNNMLANPLSAGEEEAVRRNNLSGDVQAGLMGTPTATNTALNLMKFGDAARSHQMQALGAATSFLPASRTNFDPVQVALGRPGVSNAQSQFAGVQKPSDEASQLGAGLMNNLFSTQGNIQNINANRRDSLDRLNEFNSSLPT